MLTFLALATKKKLVINTYRDAAVGHLEKNEDGLAFENGKKQFYGETMSVECLGFVRPEMKFNGLDELVTRIKTDVGLSKNSLMKMGI